MVMLLVDGIVDDVDVEVALVMDVQELLVIIERCLEGIEEVTNPNDVGYDVDDDHHSFDGVMKVPLFCDAPLNHNEELEFDVALDELLGLDDEVQSSLLADFLLGQQDEYYLVHVDVLVDVDNVDDTILVQLLLDVLDSFDVVLFLYQRTDADDNSEFCCGYRSPGC